MGRNSHADGDNLLLVDAMLRFWGDIRCRKTKGRQSGHQPTWVGQDRGRRTGKVGKKYEAAAQETNK